MAAYNITLWVCDVCGDVHSEVRKVSSYSEFLEYISLDMGDWDYLDINNQEALCCSKCGGDNES